jgi:hypothetical protein
MKRTHYIALTLSLFLFGFITCGSLTGQNRAEDQQPVVNILKSDLQGLTMQISFPEPKFRKTEQKESGFFCLEIPGCYPSGTPGLPDLPLWNRMIEMPAGAVVTTEIANVVSIPLKIPAKFSGQELIPVQFPEIKSEDSKNEFVRDKVTYSLNEWFDYGLVRVMDEGIMRNARIGRLSVSPVVYHPQLRQLKYVRSVTIHISFSATSQDPVAWKRSFASPFYDPSSFTLNGQIFSLGPLTSGPAGYLILSDSMFMQTLQPFIEWKRKKGFKVTEVYKGSPGVGNTTSSMKAFLKNIWDASTPANPAPAYLLIVGDVQQIPAFSGTTGSHVTDLYYAEYTGDIYPELEYGRFSATTTQQLQAQINKTLVVEQFGMPSSGYLQYGLLVAGNDAGHAPVWANGQMNYAQNEYIQPGNGMQPQTFLYPTSSGQVSQIFQRFNEGVSIVNYSAHGSSSGWTDPAFTSTDVNTLTNIGRYPTVISNACETNRFTISQCFGESLLRAENKGAVGHIGASDLSYWDEDYYFSVGMKSIVLNPSYLASGLGFYDRLFHTHNEPYSQWGVTQGGLIQSGNMAVTQAGVSVDYYWEIYHLLGDPSLMPYLGIPASPSVTFQSVLPTGLTQITIQTDPYLYVALSANGVLHGAGVANSSGILNLQITPITQPVNALLVVTGQNRVPIFDTIHFITPNGPFVLADSISMRDQGGNGNQIIEAGEPILLDVRARNFTGFSSGNLTVKLQCADPYVSLTDSIQTGSALGGLSSAFFPSAFGFQISLFVPDQHLVTGTIRIEDGANVWQSPFSFIINSPVINILDIMMTDQSGNKNGLIEPGENFEFRVKIRNNGHAGIQSLSVNLNQSSSLIQLFIPVITMPAFLPGQTYEVFFAAGMQNTSIPKGSYVKLDISSSKNGYSDQLTLYRMINRLDEGFETGNYSSFPWILNGNQPWYTTTDQPFEGFTCSRSGVIPDQAATSLEVQIPVLSRDSIYFVYKVSSEEDYDFLIFSINQKISAKWSGQQLNWTMVSFPVDSGLTTFKWSYEKDYGTTEGQDCAWLDYILFPATSLFSGINKGNLPPFRLAVSPNPSAGDFSIKLISEKETEGNLMVFNAVGVLVSQHVVRSNREEIHLDFKNLPSGYYVITLDTPEGSVSKKLIKF